MRKANKTKPLSHLKKIHRAGELGKLSFAIVILFAKEVQLQFHNSIQSAKFPIMFFKASKTDLHVREIGIHYQVLKSNLPRETTQDEGTCHTF